MENRLKILQLLQQKFLALSPEEQRVALKGLAELEEKGRFPKGTTQDFATLINRNHA